jgi:hypothetical protein
MPAQYRDGSLTKAKSPESRQCTGQNAKLEPCKAWAVRGSDPPLCPRHSMSDEEWSARSMKGGRSRSRKYAIARAQRELTRHGPKVPLDTHREAVKRLYETEERLVELCLQGRLSPAELPEHLRERVR